MPALNTSAKEDGLKLEAHQVEDALVEACKANAIRDPELLASLTQSVCFWHRLDEDGQDNVLHYLAKYVH